MKIALVDYGAGNLTSVRKGLAAAGADVITPERPSHLADADGVVVPGVGHFACTRVLEGEWRDAIAGVVEGGTPLLGICLGLQWLFDGSDEAPDVAGLGAIQGTCTRLPPLLKVPHVGWNALAIDPGSRLLAGIPTATQVYFTHSYAAPVTSECVATTTHGVPFAAAVERGRLFGVQFHPEKSGPSGVRILRNFVELCGS